MIYTIVSSHGHQCPMAPSVHNPAVLIGDLSMASDSDVSVVVFYNAFVETDWPGGCLDNRASRTVHEAWSVPLPSAENIPLNHARACAIYEGPM